MKINRCPFGVVILFSSALAVAASADEEIDIVLKHASGTTYALVWIDLTCFDRNQSVPSPNQMLNFADEERHPESRVNRLLMPYVGELRELGVNRLWFCVYPGYGCTRTQRSVLPCVNPQKVAAFLTAKNISPGRVRIEPTKDAVVVHFEEAINERFGDDSRAKWDGVERVLPELAGSHGYIGRDAFYFFLAPANSAINKNAELHQHVNAMVPHVRFFYFRKQFPVQNYRISIVFDTLDSLKVARDHLSGLIAETEQKSRGIRVSTLDHELRIAATSPEGERRLEQVINVIRPDYGTQLP